MVKRQSPQMVAKRIHHLKTQRRKNLIKPPYDCPLCFGIKTVRITEKEDFVPKGRTFTFVCVEGCFKETVECRTSNFEPVDGYNILADKFRRNKLE